MIQKPKLLGSRICGGNTAYGRNKSDYYPTPPEVTTALLDFLDIPKNQIIWEPACGQNYMVDVMKSCGYRVIATDILKGVDFLISDLPENVDWIITNPPFSLSELFISRCIDHNLPFALLLKSQYWHAKRRLELFRGFKPKYICPLTWRPDFLFKTRGSGSPLMDVMWCIWEPRWSSLPAYIPLEKPNYKLDSMKS